MRDAGFNSRAREGRDLAVLLFELIFAGFNSRAREGRDGTAGEATSSALGFNSRAREGRDCRPAHRDHRIRVSTHAPARGATGR